MLQSDAPLKTPRSVMTYWGYTPPLQKARLRATGNTTIEPTKRRVWTEYSSSMTTPLVGSIRFRVSKLYAPWIDARNLVLALFTPTVATTMAASVVDLRGFRQCPQVDTFPQHEENAVRPPILLATPRPAPHF